MNNCKGTIWRYRKNNFINSKGEIVYSERLTYLKRKSCEGQCQPSNNPCESGWLIEAIGMFLSESGELPEIPDNAKDGCLLELKYGNFYPEYGLEEVWFEVYEEHEK